MTDHFDIEPATATTDIALSPVIPDTPLENKISRLVLVGNPNVGKSVFFNYFSGLYVDVSNYPGTTIDVARARVQRSGKEIEVCDTPGAYGISSFNDEERVTREVVMTAATVLNIVDATNLERDLFLTLQLCDMQFPMVVVLNMTDAAAESGLEIDVKKLEALLGVPVVETIATKKKGFEKVEAALSHARRGNEDKALQASIQKIIPKISAMENKPARALMILEGDEIVAAENGLAAMDEREAIYVGRRNRVNQIVQQTVRESSSQRWTARVSEKVGQWTINPITGLPILFFALWLIYQAIGVMVAQRVVGYTEVELGNKRFEPFAKHLFARITPATITADVLGKDAAGEEITLETKRFSFPDGTNADEMKLNELNTFIANKDALQTFEFSEETLWGKFVVVLAGEFGAITMTVTYLLFLLLPLIVGFYLFLAVLEDCGYLPRLATMVDRMLNGIGLNGRAVIPIILGFGCVTMATITTRLLQTSREKTIAASILNFAIPCSAQLAVITALLTKAGGGYSLAFAAIIFGCLVAIGTAVDSVLPGKSSALLIDLPPMRFPQPANVLKKTWIKTFSFMKEASPWFFAGAVIVSVMQVTGLLAKWVELFEPITTGWLHLPKEAALAFVMGMVRRDFGAAGLYGMALSPAQIVIALTVITLFVPCIASVMVLLKERGFKEAMTIWFGSWVFAFAIGGVVALVIR
ncbi:MAG: ferrous iron transporter B [Rhizobacter sp.]|nr:ferrous iron transporter B [Chlorobiales bacterium]